MPKVQQASAIGGPLYRIAENKNEKIKQHWRSFIPRQIDWCKFLLSTIPVTSSAVGVAYLCLSADNAPSHKHPYSFQSRQPSLAISH